MNLEKNEDENAIRNEDENFAKQENIETNGAVYGRLRKRSILGITILTAIISAFFGALFGLMSAGFVGYFSTNIGRRIHQVFPNIKVKAVDSQISKQQIIVEDSAVTDVVAKSSPAVVSIMISKDVSSSQNNLGPGGLFDQLFPGGQGSGSNSRTDGKTTQKQVVGSGSGFLITTDGMILTNKHVVDDPQADYAVVTNDGKNYPVKILAKDPVRDVALLKIDGFDFPILNLGNSDAISAGQTVMAIGDSLGEFNNSVSRGIISGLRRNVDANSSMGDSERLTNVIQTDAAINPGNSGGPLIDIDGNVIGINIAMAQGAENIGFALPINQVKRLIDQVQKGVQFSVPYLGIRYVTIDSVVQQQAQLPFDYGVLVTRGNTVTDLAVIPGSPADLAGIVENDIILEINGQKMTKDNQLSDVISRYNAGDQITLKVWHKGQTNDVQATLQELKS